MANLCTRLLVVTFLISFLIPVTNGLAEPVTKIGAKDRCSVCGMFVAKYQGWICQIHYKNGEPKFFDGVKDTLAFYFHPEKFGGESAAKIIELWTKDYYSLQWIEMKKAYYVKGSDVNGPMGHELIPFSSKKAAVSFQKDHHGKKILTFEQITPEIIASMRMGHKMK